MSFIRTISVTFLIAVFLLSGLAISAQTETKGITQSQQTLAPAQTSGASKLLRKKRSLKRKKYAKRSGRSRARYSRAVHAKLKRQKSLKQREANLRTWNRKLIQREKRLKTQERAYATKATRLAEQEATIKLMETKLSTTASALDARTNEVSNRENAVKDKESQAAVAEANSRNWNIGMALLFVSLLGAAFVVGRRSHPKPSELDLETARNKTEEHSIAPKDALRVNREYHIPDETELQS